MSERKSIRKIVGALLLRHRVILTNFSYLTVLEVVTMLVPLITYPYLVRVLGKEVYGMVITAQVLAAYASIFVDFGFKSVSARHISIYRNDKRMLGELLSAVLGTRVVIWLGVLPIYAAIVYLVPSFREEWWLFACAYTLTFNELLFPQFFFQGIEKMRYISLINIGIRLFSLGGIFLLIHSPTDHYLVPLLMGCGYFLAGLVSLAIIRWKAGVALVRPKRKWSKFLQKDALPLFATDLVCSIKDKLNYFLLGAFVNMGSVVVYDLGMRLISVLTKPGGIVGTVLFPRLAANRSMRNFRQGGIIVLGITVFLTAVVVAFMPWIGEFFIPGFKEVSLLRAFLLVAPVLTISSYIATCFLVAFGHGKYLFYSIIITTVAYIIALGGIYWGGWITSIVSFVFLSSLSYVVELIYRFHILSRKQKENANHSMD